MAHTVTVCISRLDTMQDEMQRLAVSVTPLPRFPAEGTLGSNLVWEC